MEAEPGVFASAGGEAGSAAFKDRSELFRGGKAVRSVDRSSSSALARFRWGPPRFDVLNFALASRDFLSETAQRKGAFDAYGSRDGVAESFRDPLTFGIKHRNDVVVGAKCGLGELR